MSFVPWKRAVEGAVFVAVVQFFIFYFQFVVTDCVPVYEVLIKSFLLTPILVFFVNWLQFELLGAACCEQSKSEARKVIAFGGVTKALVVTWATTPLQAVSGLASAGLVLTTFLIAVAVFFLIGYESAVNMNEIEELQGCRRQ